MWYIMNIVMILTEQSGYFTVSAFVDVYVVGTHESQSIPSLMPFPSMTEQATILQFRSLSSPNFKASEISPAPCAPGYTLLVKHNKGFYSSYLILLIGKYQQRSIFELVFIQH